MKKLLKNQQGAIIIMTVFLIFVYIAFAALFVDGFRLYETKQELDSYSQYITETLNKLLVDEMEPYKTCSESCDIGNNEEYIQCLQDNECVDDDETCKNNCTNDCIKSCKVSHPCYERTFNSRFIATGGQVIGNNCGNTTACCEIAHSVKSSIEGNHDSSAFWGNKNYVINNTGGNTCETTTCSNNIPGVKCNLSYDVLVDDLIFAGIFAMKDSSSKFAKGSGKTIKINVTKKSCYDAELETSYIYPFYFE